MSRPMALLARLAVVSGVAAALPAAAVAWAQARKDRADPPRSAVTAEFVPSQKIEVAPAKAPPPAIMEKFEIRALGLPAPPAAAPAPAAVPEAVLEPMIQQVTQPLRAALRAELRVLTSASDPTPTQRREIAIEGARAVKDAARKLAAIQHSLQNGGWQGGAIPDGPKLIREGVLAAARARLSPEQFQRYQQELDAKAQEQRKVIALNLVANLDRLLLLSHEQREKIGEALLSHWDDRTFPTLENLANYETYFPVLPDRFIAPLLNTAQRSTWNGVQKVTFGQSFQFFNHGNVAVDAADADEDEKAAMAAVEKKK